MVEIYIDYRFFDSLAKIYNSSNKIHQNFKDFIKLVDKPTIYTNISEEELDKLVESNMFWWMLTEKVPKIIFNMEESKFSQPEVINNGTAFKIFFLDFKANECAKFSQKYGFAFFNVESFEEQWKPFYFDLDREDLDLPVTNNENCNPRFDNWGILEKFNFPLNTILISDPYILGDKSLIRSNLSQIIKKLLANVPSDISIEIIITTTDGPKDLSNTAWEDRWSALKEDLKSNLDNRLDLKFALYRYPKNIPDHARFILTNYWFIKSGNSFTYFDERGKLKNNIKDDIIFRLSLLKTTQNLIKERLLDAKLFVSKSENEPKRGPLDEINRIFQNKSFDKNFRLFRNV